MSNFLQLTKPRLSTLVLVTVAVAYFVASPANFAAGPFVAVLVGMALVVGGGNALNQYAEREFDAQMPRTRSRPLPSGRVSPAAALTFGLACVVGGLSILLLAVNPLTGALAAIAAVLYVLVYTPLKRKTPLCTLVGAVPGAIPPLVGWAAARGTLDAGAWALFAIQFLWQMPHFMAISRLYREDYERGGYPMLSVVDPTGVAPGRLSLIFTLALVPATLAPFFMGLLGTAYLVISLALGLAFLGMVIWSLLGTDTSRQRWVFLSSLLYLMGLLAFMLIDRQPPMA
jgi:protoheme IX farnesyltransferase